MKTLVSASIQILSLVILLFSVNTLSAQTAADEKAINDLFTKVVKLNETGDIDGVVSFYSENTTAIFYNGMVVNGREALRETMKQYLEYQNPEDTMEVEKTSVRFLDANHAVLLYSMHGVTVMEGQKMDWKGVGTAVLVRKGSGWLIELNQDTPLMEMPGQ